MAVIKINCLNCGKEFNVLRYRKNVAKFCSHKCYAENLKGKKTQPCSRENKDKISLANSGKKNGMYGKKSWNNSGKYINCKQCGREFRIQPNEEKRGRKFCSKECSYKYQFKNEKIGVYKYNNAYRQRFKIICKQCGKEFEVQKNCKDKRRYCSKECYYRGKIGSIPYNKGKKSPEISRGKIGKKRPDMIGSTKGFKKGNIPFNKNTKGIMKSNIGSFKKGTIPHNKGKHFPQVSGSKNKNWKNGITPLMENIRKSLEYKEWRLKIYERDRFLCQMPNCDKTERIINAHHVIKFSDIIDKYNIKTLEEAIGCLGLWDINNGIILCKKCHKKIQHKESQFVPLFQEIIKLKNI
jgi:endogenous inhibitor of DNA gyrase (YacG/DUF329 family)